MYKVRQDVMRLQEGKPEVKLAMGRFDLAVGRTTAAITHLEDALEQLQARPAPPRVLSEIYTLLGHAYLDNYKLFKAESFLDQAIKSDPSSAEAHYWMGMVLLDKQDLGRARAEFETAVGLRPNYAQAYYDLGDTARRLKDRRLAERAFRKYLELAPEGTFASEVRAFLR
jgi:tetratricopeptide (TPR) repeat protein